MISAARGLAALCALVVVNAAANRNTEPVITSVYRSNGMFEGPHWSAEENALYWIDMEEYQVFRLDYDTNTVTNKTIGYGSVSLVVTIKDHPRLVLITVRSALYLLNWDTFEDDTSLRLLTAVDLGIPGNSANDGKVDALGRLWFGTKANREESAPDRASVFMIDQHNFRHPEIKVRPVSTSNGIAWSPDNRLMYYIDSAVGGVDVFDFNLENGVIQNRRSFFNFQANNVAGGPDGMTVDSDGHLWLASMGGGRVVKVDHTTGAVIDEILLPAQRITSVVFGGPDLSILYATSSAAGMSDSQLAQQPEAGSVFAIEGTGSRGLPENQFIFPDAADY